MKKILCFGDSNTYGFNPKDCSRYDENIRWTGILQKLSKGRYEIIEAGCNNRNCFAKNPMAEEMNGNVMLPQYLELKPDIVVLALGINDLQKSYNPSEVEIENGIKYLIDMTKETLPKSKIIVMAPAKLSDNVLSGMFAFQFDKTSIEKSHKIQEIYKKVAKETSVNFFNLDEIVVTSKEDGLHFTEEAHSTIAHKLHDFICNID